MDNDRLIVAAESHAAFYDDDNRKDIKIDVLNAFYAGTKFCHTDDTIREMVNRFLGWRLPEDFSPDCGIEFRREYAQYVFGRQKYEPIGTNLFHYEQAEEMVRHMLGCPKQKDSK